MKSKKKIVIIVLSVLILMTIIFSVYYFFIRDDQENSVAKLVEMTVPGATQNITGRIEDVKIETSLWKDVLVVKGWVFKQNVKEQSRELYLVFKSGNRTLIYDLENDNLPRPDVTQYFKMEGGVDNHGYEGHIPMKDLKDTTYQVGFFIKDETGQYFAMSQKEIAFFDGIVKLDDSKPLANQVSAPTLEPTAKIKYFFEQFDISANKLNIKGWAFLEGMNTDSLKTYIVLKNAKTKVVFSTVVQPRPDVTSCFKDTRLNLDLSGFSSQIDGRDLENGRYDVCLYLVRGNQVGFSVYEKFWEIGK